MLNDGAKPIIEGGLVMPRPKRCRRICGKPAVTGFSPDDKTGKEAVILAMDEFEVIRLVDLEKQTHEQCAKQMDISRSTVTEIYERAREKLADCIVNGRRLEIDGGSYRLCDGNPKWCYKKHCERQNHNALNNIFSGGDNIMRIAVAYENGEIFQHFGHTEQFKIYDVEDNKIVSSQVVDTNGSGHGALAGFLKENKVDALVCGGIGGGARSALSDAGIKLYGGVQGNADEAVSALLANSLSYNPNVDCDRHGHGHHGHGHHGHGHHGHEHHGHHGHEHEHGHGCGDHGCGNHSCH